MNKCLKICRFFPKVIIGSNDFLNVLSLKLALTSFSIDAFTGGTTEWVLLPSSKKIWPGTSAVNLHKYG